MLKNLSRFRIRLVGTPDKLTVETRATLNTLERDCFPFDDLYPKTGCYWWLVYDDIDAGLPVGYAGLKPLKGSNAGVGFLCRAGVLEGVEGSGLQRKLIRVRMAKAKKLGMEEVISYTHNENFSSAANLLKCGLRFYKPPFKWGCPGALYFSKVLN